MVAGNIADLSFSLQAVKGTPAATGQHRTYLTGGGVNPDREINDVEETSSSRLRSTAFVSQVSVGGEPVMAVRPNMIGLLLYAAMGGKAVTGAGDPWTHTFTLANTQPWLTIFRMLGGISFERYADCKISSLNFESSSGGILQVTAAIAGLLPAFKTAAEVTVSPETTEPFLHMDARSQLLFESAHVSRISRVAVSIGTGVETVYGDQVAGDDVSEGMHDITIETDQTIADMALWNRLHYGSASPADNAAPTGGVIELGATGIDLKWTKRTAAGAAASPERSLNFTATRVQVAGIDPTEPNTDGSPLTRTVRYKVYQPGSGSGLTAIVKNGTTTYTAI